MTFLELKLFYRTQRDLATALNQLIDAYWSEKIKEAELIEGIKSMYLNNQDKLMKNNEFTTVVQQQCGKRRLAIVERILEIK
ncbi:TIGR04540 family protein [Psychrobacillus sp. PGGUH221]|uniref:TIGR04540 family protein n=1 Tax=Psychrobacillus sp. PGGUH221 TaxID=3020058 RepID=UPI0035C734D3